MDLPVIVDVTQLSKPVHEEADAGPGRANHLGKRFLGDLDHHGLWRAVLLAIIRHLQQQPRQSPLARIEQLVDQAGLDPHGVFQDMGHEEIGKALVCMDQPKHGGLFDPHEDAVRESGNGPHAVRLARETFVTEEFTGTERGRKNRFLALI
jgi:hypothetical protein